MDYERSYSKLVLVMLLVKLLLIIYNYIYINSISEYRYRPILPKKRCQILPAAKTFF